MKHTCRHALRCLVAAAFCELVCAAATAAEYPQVDTGGPYVGYRNSPVQLSAAGSLDVDGDPLTFSWDTNGDGVFGDSARVSPTVTYTMFGTTSIAVQVTNPAGLTSTGYTTVDIVHRAPVADLGALAYSSPIRVAVQFDGSASLDADGDPLHYSWDLNADGVFGDSTSVMPTAIFANPGTYDVGLKVSNDFGGSDTRFVSVDVFDRTPVASAGGPYTITPGGQLRLDGSASTDPDGDSLTYAWDLDGNGFFTDSSLVRPLVTAGPGDPVGSDFLVGLRVTDSFGKSDTSYQEVTVISARSVPEPPVPVLMLAGCLACGVARLRGRRR